MLSLFDTSCLAAPMVNQSDAPFRMLCLNHGATAAYTQMLLAEIIVRDYDSGSTSYLDAYLPAVDFEPYDSPPTSSTSSSSSYACRPLIVQIAGNDPTILAKAVDIITDKYPSFIDAIDFNLGCPQDRAKQGLYGSYLLDKCHWSLVYDCVSSMNTILKSKGVHLFCKIRIVEVTDGNLEEGTKEFVSGLVERGVRLVTIHGRRRGMYVYMHAWMHVFINICLFVIFA